MKVFSLTLAASLAATAVWTQQKPPQIKSQKEAEAVMAIQNAADSDARIQAVENLLSKFADTEYKAYALQTAAMSAQEKNDYEKMVLYAERTLEADPKSYIAMLMMASGIPQRTREFDLDKEEKLGRAEKLAKDAMEELKIAVKLNPALPDEQWEAVKKDLQSQAHDALGMVALVRKKFDVAIEEFKASIGAGGSSDPATKVRLGTAYVGAGKNDEAIAALDEVLADPQLNPVIRQYAQQEKKKAEAAKAVKK